MNPLEDEFDPHAPANLAGAVIAGAQAHATALGLKTKIAELKGSDLDWAAADAQQAPPMDLPSLPSIEGPSHMQRARVIGYQIQARTFYDLVAPDGRRLTPGDEGFLQAHMARIGAAGQSMPKGFVFEERAGHHLLAIIDGNPHLLVQQARSLGYATATAWSAHQLDLGEIEFEEPAQGESIPRPRG